MIKGHNIVTSNESSFPWNWWIWKKKYIYIYIFSSTIIDRSSLFDPYKYYSLNHKAKITTDEKMRLHLPKKSPKNPSKKNVKEPPFLFFFYLLLFFLQIRQNGWAHQLQHWNLFIGLGQWLWSFLVI